MHGREGEERKHRRHMWPAPAPGTAATTAGAPPSRQSPTPVEPAAETNHSFPDSFLKDGREIHVGDCALFRADNSPPFIGLVRWFTSGKDEHLKLGVNWLYRPSDINLAKGTSLEAAPNEVFYSFHRDEISAESLLHPCKVAFLRKGVELPTGISSFVCRRVYDTTTKCLWWLTDQDYINERQEEVDQLLDKTRLEMRAVVQSGGRSPKPLNGPSSAQLLKSGCESGQNNNTSFPSQVKGKKRGEKGDQSSESAKECSPKVDEGDAKNFTVDSIKAEIAKITDKSGLINNDAVEKLVNLMQLDRSEKKFDVAVRALLADVIAGTDRNDCLGRFVQLHGVPLLDDWLQEAHKGKYGDGSCPKEGDKSIDELLLSLLRALDKLPVNLNALQACNIGKSVNHLRGHKNSEIQKKARSLVDAWKKRVDAEMTKIEMARPSDAKTPGSSQAVSWAGKSGFSGVSYGGNKRASNDLAGKNSTTQPSCKSAPVKVAHGDFIIKASAAPSISSKSTLTSSSSVSVGSKDPQTKTGGSAPSEPSISIKEEKVNGSTQTSTNDLAKAMGFSCKEEIKNSTASSMAANRAGGSSRHRKSSNGFLGSNASGIQKDTGVGKSSSQPRGSTFEKTSTEKTIDLPVAEQGSHRLVVRFPNPVRSPVRSVNGNSPEETSVAGSQALSPGLSEKNEHIDRKMKVKTDICQAYTGEDGKTELWQNDDVKTVIKSEDGSRSPADFDEESKVIDDPAKLLDTSKSVCSSAKKVKLTSSKTFEPSLSSINALIESCINYTEASVSPSGVDDLGMNLLASVAAGEMSKSDLASPTDSPRGSPLTSEEHSSMGDAKLKDNPNNNTDVDVKKLEVIQNVVLPNDLDHNMVDSSNDCNSVMPSQENKGMTELKEHHTVSSLSCQETVEVGSQPVDVAADVCVHSFTSPADFKDGRKSHPSSTVDSPESKRRTRSPVDENDSVDCVHEKVLEGNTPLDFENDANPSVSNNRKTDEEVFEGASCQLDPKKTAYEGSNDAMFSDQHLPPVAVTCLEDVSGAVDSSIVASDTDSVDTCSETDAYRKEKLVKVSKSQFEIVDHSKKGEIKYAGQALDDKIASSVLCSSNSTGEDTEMKGIIEQHSSLSPKHERTLGMMKCENEQRNNSMDPFNGLDNNKMRDVAYPIKSSSAVNSLAPTFPAKLSFDLNEGLSGDEGNTVLSVVSTGGSSTMHLMNLPHFNICPIPSNSPVSITVANPAKGAFLPPENLLKSRGELGWKGSAATSAFRPAEPRKVLDSTIGVSDVAADKQCRLPFDLNVIDEGAVEDAASQNAVEEGSELGTISKHGNLLKSSGGLDLDLNRADEYTETGDTMPTGIRGEEAPLLPVKTASVGISQRDASTLRDFDLNNGPGFEEGGAEHIGRGQIPKVGTLPFLSSLRVNNNEIGSVSSWFTPGPGNSYPAVAIPSFLPDRGDHTYPVVPAPGGQRMLGSTTGNGAYGSDLYRGPVLSSSPAMAFAPTAAFSYASFPFGSSFPVASTSFAGGSATYVDSAPGGSPCYPAIPAPPVGPSGSAQAPCMRPYLISLPEGSTSGGSVNIRKWGWQGLDLNAGPGSIDVEGRDERLPLTSRQLPVANTQVYSEEQTRIYQAAGGVLKRKEPEGGWDIERLTYKQPSWQ